MQRMNRDAHRLRGRWLQVAGRKDMRAPHLHTLRQEKSPAPRQTSLPYFFNIMVQMHRICRSPAAQAGRA